MAGALSGGYFPVYPQHDNLPDPEIRIFITNFYRVSDNPDSNELWISYFDTDATVTMGNDTGHGEQEIRELRGRMWTVVKERKHTVNKVFPAIFQEEAPRSASQPETGSSPPAKECELMLFGHVDLKLKDGKEAQVPWAGHAVLRKGTGGGEKGEWKFASYRVWLQR